MRLYQMEKRYQIFVSSTFKDLIDARLKVLEVIVRLKHFPAGMEYFPSSNARAWEVIKKIIVASDFYVLIIAGRYGSVDVDGLGFTEKEYDYAVEIGKHVLAFIHANPGQLARDNSENEPAVQDRLDRFVAKVRLAHTITEWNSAEDLAVQVTVALVSAFEDSTAVGWMRADGIDNTPLLKQIAALLEENRAFRIENERLARGDIDEERVRVTLGFDTTAGGGLDAQVYNCGSIPVYVTSVALIHTTLAETTPIGDTTLSIDLKPAAGAKTPAEDSIDIQPKKQVRFRLGIESARIVQPFLDANPEGLAITVSTFGGEIHRVEGEQVRRVLAQVAAIWEVVQQEATPKYTTVRFLQGGPNMSREAGSMRIITFKRIEDGMNMMGIDSISPELVLTEEDRLVIASQVVNGQVIGSHGEYEWRVD